MWGMGRALVAAMLVTLLGGTFAAGSGSEPTDAEVTALYAYRDHLATSMADVRSRLDEIRMHIAGPDWVVQDLSHGFDEVVAFDLRRLPDFVTAAEYYHRHREAMNPVFESAWARDTDLYVAIRLLAGFQEPPDDAAAATDELAAALAQSSEEKRELYRPLLQALKAERVALAQAIAIYAELLAAVAPAPVTTASATGFADEQPEGEALATEPLPDREVTTQEGDCRQGSVRWSPAEDVTHGRWNGVWDQYGGDGIEDLTLTQSGYCVFGTYDYEDWSLWLNLMVTGERELTGYWFSDDSNHQVTCDEQRDGVWHWGEVHMRFDDLFTRFWGEDGACGGIAAGLLDAGVRVR